MTRFSSWFSDRTAIFLFIAALILRVIWFLSVEFNEGSWFVHDSQQFMLLAENLLDHGVFSRSTEAPFFPDIARTPGYPVFLWFFELLDLSPSFIATFQLVLSACIPVLLFKTAKEMDMSSPALAGILVLLDFSLILFAPFILSDGLFLFLLALFIWTCTQLDKGFRNVALSGLTLGVMILVRPIAQFIPLVIIAWWIWQKLDRKKLVVFLLSCLFLPGGWMIRNYAHFDSFTLSSMGTNNLLLYNAAGVLAEVNGQDLTTSQALLARSAKNKQDWENDPLATSKYLSNCKETAIEILSDHPVVFLKQTARSAALLPFKPARSYVDMTLRLDYVYEPVQGLSSTSSFIEKLRQAWQRSSPFAATLSVYQFLFNILVFVMAVLAMWQNGTRKKWVTLLVLLLLYFWGTSLVTQPDARFRMPMALMLMLLASNLNIRDLRTKPFGRRRKSSHPTRS